MEITGDQVLDALAMLGERVGVRGHREEAQHSLVIEMRYIPAGQDHCHEVSVWISDESVASCDDPNLPILEAMQKELVMLVPERVRNAAARVLLALRNGPLQVEFIGGPRDGEVVYTPGADERPGWPMTPILVPLESYQSLSFVRDEPVLGPSETVRIGVYERELVSPQTLHWRYLWAGER